jgi:hypothetical protein
MSETYCEMFRALGLELEHSPDVAWIARFAELTKWCQGPLGTLSSFALWTSLAIPERISGSMPRIATEERT